MKLTQTLLITKPTPTQTRFGFLSTLLGIAVAILGMFVMLGWLLHVRAMVEIRAGYVAMVFNTALCFALTGMALALPGLRGRPTPKFQTLVGGIVLVLCATILVEHIFDKSLGIDWAFLHTWLRDGNIRPGRLAPNTALGFMLIGTTLILMSRVSNKWRASLVQILTFGVLAVGLTGLIGYTLAPDLLFGWARSARMAIHTATGMMVSSIALWLSWHHAEWYRSRRFFQVDDKINLIGAAILAVLTITAGMTGFVFQQQVLENALRENLRVSLKGRVILFQTAIQQGAANTDYAANVFGAAAPNDDHAALAATLLANGFRGLALFDLQNKLLVRVGAFARAPEIVADLHAITPARILWDGDLYLQTDTAVRSKGVIVAHLLAEQSLSTLRRQLFDTEGLGKTGEIALCKAENNGLFCFPEGRLPIATRIKRQSASGQALPMSLAVDGKSGIGASVDYREKNVMAAYGPLAPGVGLVVKEETAELYQVIRDQLKAVVPALLLLVVVGVIFLRSQLKPLTTRLIASERKATEKELEIKAVVSSVGEGILIIDQSGVIESFNSAASHIFGYPAVEVIGKGMKILMPPEMRDLHEKGMLRYLQGGEPHVIGRQGVELPGLRKDGSTFPLEVTVNEIRLEHRRLFVGIVRDITERKQTEEKLIYLAQYDSLTGLPNRSLFMDRLSSAARRAARNQSGLGVMFLDLDGFKEVNDTLGHHSGDDLLKQFAQRLTTVVRKTDTVSRLAGDEFTILLEGLVAPQLDTQAVAEKIIAAMQPPFLLGDKSVVVTASIGLAIYIAGEFNLEELLRRADHAMYRAKNSGKNRWCFEAFEQKA
jgi:diguanylate cyclase (GGDEF)-like protein/PAS domain S-box-containing protein